MRHDGGTEPEHAPPLGEPLTEVRRRAIETLKPELLLAHAKAGHLDVNGEDGAFLRKCLGYKPTGRRARVRWAALEVLLAIPELSLEYLCLATQVVQWLDFRHRFTRYDTEWALKVAQHPSATPAVWALVWTILSRARANASVRRWLSTVLATPDAWSEPTLVEVMALTIQLPALRQQDSLHEALTELGPPLGDAVLSALVAQAPAVASTLLAATGADAAWFSTAAISAALAHRNAELRLAALRALGRVSIARGAPLVPSPAPHAARR